MAQARGRNPRGTGARLRDEIIDAGITLIDDTNDAAALTLRGIARAAGIAAPSIYRHFPDLQAVTDAVLERSFTQLETLVAAAMQAAQTPEQRAATPVILRIETKAGHGAGTPTAKTIALEADRYAFFAHALGMK